MTDARLSELRASYQSPEPEPAPAGFTPNAAVEVRHLILRTAADGRATTHQVDSLFPQVMRGKMDMAGVDEGTADLLYGLVRSLQPRVVLETGTHKGRSTRAIATALRDNAEPTVSPFTFTAHLDRGHLYTVDAEDWKILTSGAISENAAPYVTPIIGWTPGVLQQDPLGTLEGIEFAFLDGDHSAEGLDAELTYVDLHRAKECWVAIDNSRDKGWPGIARTLHGYTKYPRISLGTCTGLDLIWMHD